MLKRINHFLFYIIILGFGGCLKDNITTPVSIKFENGAELVHYLEETGDYINSIETPSVVEASEVFNNLSNYLIIDIRPDAEYSAGHIEGAVNINHTGLLTYLNSLSRSYTKIILVSKNGQSSAYYTGLLRLYGINNIFSLNFGMAAWHNDFAEDWKFITTYLQILGFVEAENLKGPLYDLPAITYNNPSASPATKVRERIISLLNEDFSESGSSGETGPSIIRDEFLISSAYIICYGEKVLYSSKLYGIFHPANAVYFSPPTIFGDFKSTRYLQALPNNRRVIVYSYDGNLSAVTVAYLRVLGYNASSLLFGGNSLIFGMSSIPGLENYAFTYSRIMNYPYVKNP